MGRSKGFLVVFTVIFLFLLVIVDKFFEEGKIRLAATCILVLGSFYQVIVGLAPRHPSVISMNRLIRRVAIGRLLIGEEVSVSAVSGDLYYLFKSQLLLLTTTEVDKRSEFINTGENFAFALGDEFNQGTDPVNQSKAWRDHLHEQFVFITGRSGSGKTFELVRRTHHVCKQLSPGLANRRLLERTKIPVFIELKTLDGKLQEDWIVDYLYRTAKVSGFEVSRVQLRHLLNEGEVIYFFDGLDEVRPEFRKAAVSYMIKELKGTGVHVSCRRAVYKILREKNDIPALNLPAEYPLLPVNPEWIQMIISSLQDRPKEEIEEMIELTAVKPGLMVHLSRPIFLNLFILVYPNLTQEEKQRIALEGEDAATDLLWENYEDILYRNKLDRHSDLLGIRTMTVWLAKIMQQRPFYVESIQPFWLAKVNEQHEVVPHRQLQKLYFVFTRVIAAMIIGIALGCILATPFALIPDSIVGGVVVSAIAGIYSWPKHPGISRQGLAGGMFTLCMVFLLVVFCGLFQGLVLPRAPGDMLTPYFSVAECWPGVLLGITLSTIFSYRIIMEKARQQYILPVELFHFDWPHAIRYGLSWGIVSGIITGGIALYVKDQFKDHLFIKDWLVPYLEDALGRFSDLPLTGQNINWAVFIYAFLLTFSVASVIIILLAGRYNDPPEKNMQNKQKLNFGIKQSARYAAIHAVYVALLSLIIYYLVMLRLDLGSIYFALKITFGITLLAFLWFGGMEVINHWLLRVNLFIRDIAPLNYDTWVAAQEQMGFVIPSGYRLKFYHATLANYYMRYPLNQNPRIRIKTKVTKDLWAYGIAFVILAVLMSGPFIRRYITKSLWASPYEVNLISRQLRPVGEGEYRADRSGIYQVDCSGYLNVGTFVGYVQPKGTEQGFLGMPINDPYDLDSLKRFPHAALLYRVKPKSGVWSPFKALAHLKRIILKQGDHLQFLTNDKEWQNNIGRYVVRISPCDTCKPQL